MLIVVITIITLIISFITSMASLVFIMKLNLIPGLEPIKYNDNLTTIQNDFLVLNQIYLNENKISVKEDINGNLSFETPNAYLKLNSDQIEFYAKDELAFKSIASKNKLFPPDFSKIDSIPISHLAIPNGLQMVNKIRSPTDQDLRIEASNSLVLKGNNGLKLDSKQISLKSSQISINSLNSTINFDTTNGEIYLQFENNLRIQSNNKKIDLQEQSVYYKLCICGNGLLFKLMIKDETTKCNDVRFPVSSDPCSKQSRI